MTEHTWELVLGISLVANALLGFGYRVYRLSRGGPMGDVIGQGVLGIFLLGSGIATLAGAGWTRWPALFYAVLFGLIVMPVWTLAVLIPLPPGKVDYAFTVVYWLSLAAIAVSAIAI
jgi:hypothetical protein